MPFITINGQQVQVTVAELVEYERATKPVTTASANTQPITCPPPQVVLPPPVRPIVVLPEPEPPVSPVRNRKDYTSPSDIHRKILEERGYRHVGVIMAGMRTLAENTDILGEVVRPDQQRDWLLEMPDNFVQEISSLISVLRKSYSHKVLTAKGDKRKAWLPGIFAAMMAVLLEDGPEHYQRLRTRFTINEAWIEHVFAINHKVFEDWGVTEMTRARLNPKARKTLFEDLYFLFCDKDFQIGTTA